MTVYKVGWDATNKIVYVENNADALPGGVTNLGTFTWTPTDDNDGYDDNVTIFHFVRDKLYAIGVQDMQSVDILVSRVRSISVGSPTVTIAPAATSQIVVTFVPANALNKELVYTSSNTSKATVSPTGLITGVATGSATITVTTQDGSKTATVAVTVS